MVAHRRAGKTVACVNEIITRAIYSKKKRPRYAYIAPLRTQAEKIAWEYLKEYTRGLEKKKPSETDLTVIMKHNDAEICIFGADNPDAFRGQYFDGVILDEYGDMHPSVWGKNLLPTLADRRGWAVFIGTPKGKNHFWKIFNDAAAKSEDWFRYILKASESGILSDDELALQRSEMTEDEYNQEYECSFDAAIYGAYYATLLAKHENQVSSLVEYEPDFPVDVWTDLGYTDSSAFWFAQTKPDGLAIIDHYEENTKPLEHYFSMLRAKSYKYGTIWLPHDARQKTLQTGRSTLEQFLDQELPQFYEDQSMLIRVSPNLSVQSGIDAARFMIPKLWFNPRCRPGIDALIAYHRAYNEKTKSYSDQPAHDWASHSADAFRYLCLTARERIVPSTKKPVVPTFKPPIYTLDDLFEMRESTLNISRGRI